MIIERLCEDMLDGGVQVVSHEVGPYTRMSFPVRSVKKHTSVDGAHGGFPLGALVILFAFPFL